MKKLLGHLKTITHHHNLVCSYCFKAGLYRQGLMHDLSKLSPTELLVGAKYFQGTRSPNNAERESKGYSSSWLHHKGRNKHHFEYWIDYSLDPSSNGLCGTRMPRRYVAEMIFDRVSASRTYLKEYYNDSSALDYYLRAKDKMWFVHPDTKRDMEFLLRMWAKKGETYTIRYIRQVYLKDKDLKSIGAKGSLKTKHRTLMEKKSEGRAVESTTG